MQLVRLIPLLLMGFPFCQTVLAQAVTSGNSVVVSRGDAEIRFVDIDARMSRIPADKRAGFMDSPDRIEKSVSDLLLTRQAAIEARKLGIDNDPVVQADIQLFEEEVLARRLMAVKLANIEYPSFETVAHERYLAHPEKYTSQEVLTVRHLVILRDIHGDEGARKLAEERRDQFLKSGQDFESFVVEYSEEPSRATAKGLVDGLVRGQGAGEFEAAAFALRKPGDISDVTRTRYGYHIIQLIKRQPERLPPFEKIRDQITAELRADYQEKQRQKIIESFQVQEMVADPDRVQSLRTRYLPDGAGTVAISPFDPMPTGTTTTTAEAEVPAQQ